MRDRLKINKYSKSQSGHYLMKMRKFNTTGAEFLFSSCQWQLINSLKLLSHYVMRGPNHLVARVSTSPPRQ